MPPPAAPAAARQASIAVDTLVPAMRATPLSVTVVPAFAASVTLRAFVYDSTVVVSVPPAAPA